MQEREELAWAAGLYDGEGCTLTQVFSGGGRSIRMVIGQQHPEVLERFQAAVGLGNISYPKSTKPNGQPRAIRLNICSQEKVQAVLAMLWPWLGSVKREQAIAALTKVRQRG